MTQCFTSLRFEVLQCFSGRQKMKYRLFLMDVCVDYDVNVDNGNMTQWLSVMQP